MKPKKGQSPVEYIKELNDNAPITAIQILENTTKCPGKFQTIRKTFDRDDDANLWGDASLFARKQSRYLCYSKQSYVVPYYIVEALAIIEERDYPPEGYSVLNRTVDTEQRAWRKRQLCYKLSPADKALTAVTNVFVFSSDMKKAKGYDKIAGYQIIGNINGFTICCITQNLRDETKSFNFPKWLENLPSPENEDEPLANFGLKKFITIRGNDARRSSADPSVLNRANDVATQQRRFSDGKFNGNEDYEYISPYASLMPVRAAPMPPPRALADLVPKSDNYYTLKQYSELEGVTFKLNDAFRDDAVKLCNLPDKPRAIDRMERDYEYNFRLERQNYK